MNKAEKSGNNVNSQKIRKYLSSPKREPPLPHWRSFGGSCYAKIGNNADAIPDSCAAMIAMDGADSVSSCSLDIWTDIHPSLITLPMEWEYEIPYGIVYAKEPSKSVQDFIDIVEERLR